MTDPTKIAPEVRAAPEVRVAEPVAKIHIDHLLTDSEYILALIDETFSNVPQIKQHHVRMRGIAERLAHPPTAPSVPAPAPHPAEDLAMMIRMLVSSLKRHWPYPRTWACRA